MRARISLRHFGDMMAVGESCFWPPSETCEAKASPLRGGRIVKSHYTIACCEYQCRRIPLTAMRLWTPAKRPPTRTMRPLAGFPVESIPRVPRPVSSGTCSAGRSCGPAIPLRMADLHITSAQFHLPPSRSCRAESMSREVLKVQAGASFLEISCASSSRVRGCPAEVAVPLAYDFCAVGRSVKPVILQP